ncbi:MAG: hypothetical protein HY548_07375, partial [Elusimicrobia bacterium]|nr:hypothetical protein [Elusimicrobiota bacterium]
AGGFHSEGIGRRLKEKGVAYAILSPRLGETEGTGTEYLAVFHRDKTPLEKLFTGERLTLAADSSFSIEPLIAHLSKRFVVERLFVTGTPALAVLQTLEAGGGFQLTDQVRTQLQADLDKCLQTLPNHKRLKEVTDADVLRVDSHGKQATLALALHGTDEDGRRDTLFLDVTVGPEGLVRAAGGGETRLVIGEKAILISQGSPWRHWVPRIGLLVPSVEAVVYQVLGVVDPTGISMAAALAASVVVHFFVVDLPEFRRIGEKTFVVWAVGRVSQRIFQNLLFIGPMAVLPAAFPSMDPQASRLLGLMTGAAFHSLWNVGHVTGTFHRLGLSWARPGAGIPSRRPANRENIFRALALVDGASGGVVDIDAKYIYVAAPMHALRIKYFGIADEVELVGEVDQKYADVVFASGQRARGEVLSNGDIVRIAGQSMEDKGREVRLRDVAVIRVPRAAIDVKKISILPLARGLPAPGTPVGIALPRMGKILETRLANPRSITVGRDGEVQVVTEPLDMSSLGRGPSGSLIINENGEIVALFMGTMGNTTQGVGASPDVIRSVLLEKNEWFLDDKFVDPQTARNAKFIAVDLDGTMTSIALFNNEHLLRCLRFMEKLLQVDPDLEIHIVSGGRNVLEVKEFISDLPSFAFLNDLVGRRMFYHANVTAKGVFIQMKVAERRKPGNTVFAIGDSPASDHPMAEAVGGCYHQVYPPRDIRPTALTILSEILEAKRASPPAPAPAGPLLLGRRPGLEFLDMPAFANNSERDMFAGMGVNLMGVDLSWVGLNAPDLSFRFIPRNGLSAPFVREEENGVFVYTVPEDITVSELIYVIHDLSRLPGVNHENFRLSHVLSRRCHSAAIYLARMADRIQNFVDQSAFRHKVETLDLLGNMLGEKPSYEVKPFELIQDESLTDLDEALAKEFMGETLSIALNESPEEALVFWARRPDNILVKEFIFHRTGQLEREVFLRGMDEAYRQFARQHHAKIAQWKSRSPDLDVLEEVNEAIRSSLKYQAGMGFPRFLSVFGKYQCVSFVWLFARILHELGFSADDIWHLAIEEHTFSLVRLSDGSYVFAGMYTDIMPLELENDAREYLERVLRTGGVVDMSRIWPNLDDPQYRFVSVSPSVVEGVLGDLVGSQTLRADKYSEYIQGVEWIRLFGFLKARAYIPLNVNSLINLAGFLEDASADSEITNAILMKTIQRSPTTVASWDMLSWLFETRNGLNPSGTDEEMIDGAIGAFLLAAQVAPQFPLWDVKRMVRLWRTLNICFTNDSMRVRF